MAAPELDELPLQGELPSEEEVKMLIRKGCIANKLVPVFCGSAFKNKGVQPLLDGVVGAPTLCSPCVQRSLAASALAVPGWPCCCIAATCEMHSR